MSDHWSEFRKALDNFVAITYRVPLYKRKDDEFAQMYETVRREYQLANKPVTHPVILAETERRMDNED